MIDAALWFVTVVLLGVMLAFLANLVRLLWATRRTWVTRRIPKQPADGGEPLDAIEEAELNDIASGLRRDYPRWARRFQI